VQVGGGVFTLSLAAKTSSPLPTAATKKMLNVNTSAGADNNNLGSVSSHCSPPSRSITPTLSQGDEEGSFQNLQEGPYSATNLIYVFC
jgi:hypothetical protein